MKLKYLTTIILCTALLGVSCSKENDFEKDDLSVSRIFASDENSLDTRTVLDGYSVTWANNDALGCMNITNPVSNNKFVLSQGAGTKYGIFDVVTAADKLTEGTWIAYYPHSTPRYTSARKYRIVNQTQTDDTPNHVATYDWLISNPVKLSKETPGGEFKMKHVFALVEFKVKLKKTVDDYIELAQCVLESTDGSSIFAQNVFFDDQGNIQFDYTAKNVSVMRSPYPEFTTNYSTSWLLARQSILKPLTVRIYFIYGVISSAAVQFTPKSILEPGKKYVIELELDVNDSNPNASILTILNRS